MRAVHRWAVSMALLVATVMATVMALAGCSSQSGAVSGTPTTISTPTTRPQPTATLAVPSRVVTFTTADGLRLSGTIYGSGTTGVALAHQTDGTQNTWRGFAQQLAAHGYMALAFDFRGRGLSAGPADTAKEDVDLRAAVALLRAQGAKRIALMGASLGGAIALRVAATEAVAAVATLSAVAWWPSQPVTDDLLRAMRTPKFFLNSETDPDAEGTQHMYDVAAQPKQIQMYPGRAHGVGMFSADYSPDLIQRLLTFMDTYAPAT